VLHKHFDLENKGGLVNGELKINTLDVLVLLGRGRS